MVEKERELYLQDPGGFYTPVVEVGKRMGVASCKGMGNWYVGYSPRNGFDGTFEGDWAEWVALAHWILEQKEPPK